MLVLSRRLNESIRIGERGEIEIIVAQIDRGKIRLGPLLAVVEG